jgi:16S rRNA (cytosine1402-N4)-methyltransferase
VSEFVHQTVLRREAVTLLAAGPGKTILDGTLGGGGHALALLDAGSRVVGLDQDPLALKAAGEKLQGRDVVLIHGNFRDARALLDAAGIGEVDGALVDLGV